MSVTQDYKKVTFTTAELAEVDRALEVRIEMLRNFASYEEYQALREFAALNLADCERALKLVRK